MIAAVVESKIKSLLVQFHFFGFSAMACIYHSNENYDTGLVNIEETSSELASISFHLEIKRKTRAWIIEKRKEKKKDLQNSNTQKNRH